MDLFNPLNENKKPPPKSGPPAAHGPSPQEQRRHIIERFIATWRKDVGDDFYPALRLMLPDKDRDRGVYGLKENAIGKLLVALLKIDRNSDDGYSLLHWKIPGQTAAARLASDFAGRCFDAISKRPMRAAVGDMAIADINHQLDRLAVASGEAESLAVLETCYNRMNAEEMMWLIRIILKQLKVGATEKTLLYLWHPDGETPFSVSSSLRRVCWELHDPRLRLERDDAGIAPMQCFQPQLAQFQMPASFHKMTELLRPTDDDAEFWIEEKLDGERIQMHMVHDPGHPGGRRFGFWSRKAKDYTHLYGHGLHDDASSLTRHLADAFAPGVRNLILDGEMITWDMEADKMVPFGTLKTAAIAEQQNRSGSDAAGHRPLFRVFDVLYLNDKQLTQYTLRDRRRALEKALRPVHRRLEIHAHTRATSADAIEPLFRDVVASASEGLVLKKPRSMYRLNSRNDDWLKVKPEYMAEFGESLDCLVVGGYYGSGRRRGTLSSFLCALRATPNHVRAGANPEKCFSFFRVGGGFRAEDYAEMRHRTEGKWLAWDPANPPTEYVELGGGEAKQHEQPDVWIRPRDSVVVSVKAASVAPSDSFARGFTLRFPRFRRLRLDRSWDSALTMEEFEELKRCVDEESRDRAMTVEDRKRRRPKRAKRELVIAGEDAAPAEPAEPSSALFAGLEFAVLSESLPPWKRTKGQLEALIRENGGAVSQRPAAGTRTVLVADKRVVKVASLIKGGGADIVRPLWIRDCLEHGGGGSVLPYEERHLLHASEGLRAAARRNTDRFGDSFARDVTTEELGGILAAMTAEPGGAEGPWRIRGWLFQRCVVHLRPAEGTSRQAVSRLARRVRYGGGRCADGGDADATHVVVVGDDAARRERAAAEVRGGLGGRRRVPRLVTDGWVDDCWREKTLVDEERYAVG